VLRYAEYLGFDIENYRELLPLAYQGLITPLPDNFKRVGVKNQDEVLYLNLNDNTLMDVSPIDELVIGKYNEQVENIKKERMKQKKPKKNVGRNNKKQNAPKQPIPKTLPPLKKSDDGNNLSNTNPNLNTLENISSEESNIISNKSKGADNNKSNKKKEMLGQYEISKLFPLIFYIR